MDATADADLVWRAVGARGVEMVPPGKRINAGFYIYYGGVDTGKFVHYVIENAAIEAVKAYPSLQDPEKVRRHLREGKLIKFNEFPGITEKADARGYFTPLEQIYEREGVMFMPRLGMKWVGRDRWCVGLGGVPNLNLLDAWEVTKYETFRTVLEHVGLRMARLLPGWEAAYIARTTHYMGSRQTRTIKAKYMLARSGAGTASR